MQKCAPLLRVYTYLLRIDLRNVTHFANFWFKYFGEFLQPFLDSKKVHEKEMELTLKHS